MHNVIICQAVHLLHCLQHNVVHEVLLVLCLMHPPVQAVYYLLIWAIRKYILGGALVYRLGAYELTCTPLATPLGASVASLGGYLWVHMVWYGRVTITLLNVSEGLLLHDYTF